MAKLKENSFVCQLNSNDQDMSRSDEKRLEVSPRETESRTVHASSEKGTVSDKEETGITVSENRGGTHTHGQHSGTLTERPESLTKKQQKNLRCRQNKKFKAALRKSLSKDDEGQKKKRQISELTTSPRIYAYNFNKAKCSKRPRGNIQPSSSAEAAKPNRVVIVKEGFPIIKLSKADADLIQMETLRLIDLTPEGYLLPRISSFYLSTGTLIVNFEEKNTERWLRRLFHGNDTILDGHSLKVLSSNQITKPVRVAFKTTDIHTRDAKQLLRRMQRYNPELKTQYWRVLHHDVETQHIRWIFEVNLEASEAIKKAGLQTFTGLDKGSFKILYDHNKEEKEAIGSSSPYQKILNRPSLPDLNTEDKSESISASMNEIPSTYPAGMSSVIGDQVTTNIPGSHPDLGTIPSSLPGPVPGIIPSSISGIMPGVISSGMSGSQNIPRVPNQFGDQDLRSVGDQDLRTLPNLVDHDMRVPPVLVIDKDMRQPMVDQDFRSLGVPANAPEARPFDPRFRNMQGPDRNIIPGFDRSRPANVDPRTAHDPRNAGASPRVEDPRKASMAASINSRLSAAGPALQSLGPNTAQSSVGPASMIPEEQEKAALIMQVLQLTDQQIAALPPEQRQSIMVLKEQLARSQML